MRYLRRASELALPPAARVAPPQPPALGRPASRPGSARGGGGAGGGNGGGGGDELLVPAPGLSPDLARFVVSHRGEAYQAVALKWFGNELLRSGFPDQVRLQRVVCIAQNAAACWVRLGARVCDPWIVGTESPQSMAAWFGPGLAPPHHASPRPCPGRHQAPITTKCTSRTRCLCLPGSQAADVFYGLLLDECDRQQQADYLSLCLECWGHNAAGEPAGKAGAAGSQAAAVEADGAIITKLADFVERQHCMSAGDIVDMLAAPTALGRGGALWLCEALLARAAGGSASSDSHSRRGSAADGGAAGGSSAQLGGPRAIELMVRYVRLSSAAAAAAADSSQQAARQLQGVTPQVGGGSFKPRGGRAQRLRPAVSSPHARAVASGVLAAASLVGGGGFALRLARLLPLLMLLHTPARGRT